MSRATSFARALRRCSADVAVSVPGTPLALRIDQVGEAGPGRLQVTWSFVDPESYEGDDPSSPRRLRQETTLAVPRSGRPEDGAAQWWNEIQLAAAHRYKRAVDADWIPGAAPEAPTARSVAELWQDLLNHLGTYDTVINAEPGNVRVRERGGHVVVYEFTPEEWAAYLRPAPDEDGAPDAARVDPSPIVPAAVPLVGGLPLWVDDELLEVAGSRGSPIRLVDGRLVGRTLDGEFR